MDLEIEDANFTNVNEDYLADTEPMSLRPTSVVSYNVQPVGQTTSNAYYSIGNESLTLDMNFWLKITNPLPNNSVLEMCPTVTRNSSCWDINTSEYAMLVNKAEPLTTQKYWVYVDLNLQNYIDLNFNIAYIWDTNWGS